jgi:hypothetical protein
MRVAVDDVVFLEHYDHRNRRVLSNVATLAAIGGGTVITLGMFKALFGSCPTVYSLDEEERVLEAELFSHSISARYQDNDLDRLQLKPGPDGSVTINVANEALETHYIDSLSLLVVDHPTSYEAFPMAAQGVILMGEEAPLLSAVSKSDDDVTNRLAERDGNAYQSGTKLLEAFSQSFEDDWIELAIKIPADSGALNLAMKARNTLFSTVFLYDVAIGSQGFNALDWMGSEIEDPAYAREFTAWYQQHFGIKVQVEQDGVFRDAGEFTPTGPVAWHLAGTTIPVTGEGVMKLRLSFMPDNWAIDWVAAGVTERPAMVSQTLIKPNQVESLRGNNAAGAKALVASADENYLLTQPGDLYQVTFNPPPQDPGLARSYFLKSNGYYTEWVRMDWITRNGEANKPEVFELSDGLLQRTAEIWLRKKEQFEQQFYSSKLPVRR